MTTANLLNLDVDQIFEQHNVSEVEIINRKIQAEIENKREELRTMVGERYRDLLQAADTIAEMKISSENISANIINLNSQNQEHLMGFKAESEQQKKINRSATNNLYGVVVQIKILTTLPELIWSRIDVDDFFVATQLFIFSRHISTGLKLDVNNDIMKRFPVAKKQWDLLAPFFYTIKQQCLQTLERENLTSEVASKCLASLLLLENCQLEKLLTTFVQTRTKTFTKIIDNDDYGAAVKEKLLKSLKILISTVSIIHECFIGESGKDGLLIQELKKISDDKSRPTLSLLQQENSFIFQTLPDIIAKYKPQVFYNKLSKESFESASKSWLKSIENLAHSKLKSLIQLIVSIKTIQDIQQQTKAIEVPKNWAMICRDLYLPDNIDFFKTFYQSLINDRIQDIINLFWSTILTELNAEVIKLITDNEKVHRDMKHYVWTEDQSDNPLSLKDALSSNVQSHRLLMKVKGFTTAIVELCNKIDGNLELLFKDLKTYLGGMGDMMEFKRAKDVNPDHQKIVAYLRECSKENISSLITSIKSSQFNMTAENCITLARLLQAISELCPNLRLCFSGSLLLEPSFLRDPSKDDGGEKEWASICGLLEEESLRFWFMWMEMFVGEWKDLDHKLDSNTILRDFPCWETITIDEKDETDNVVQSQIEVPSQLCISVQCWIYEVISNLNKIVPHTLPKSVHLKIVEKIVEKLNGRYEAFSNEELIKSDHRAAWQFFLDVKILTILFVARENKQMNEKFQTLSNQFKAIIDPFDFDVFYQHVNNNIKRFATRNQHGMGILVPNMEHLNTVLANQANLANPHDKDPNIISMFSVGASVEWFPLLPVITTKEVAPTLAQDLMKKDEKKVNQQKLSKPTGAVRKQPAMAPSSSSSSALSSLQDWFR